MERKTAPKTLYLLSVERHFYTPRQTQESHPFTKRGCPPQLSPFLKPPSVNFTFPPQLPSICVLSNSTSPATQSANLGPLGPKRRSISCCRCAHGEKHAFVYTSQTKMHHTICADPFVHPMKQCPVHIATRFFCVHCRSVAMSVANLLIPTWLIKVCGCCDGYSLAAVMHPQHHRWHFASSIAQRCSKKR